MAGLKELLFACLLGSCFILGYGQDSCVQDEAPKISSCFSNFMTLMQDMGSSGGSPDPAQIGGLLCQGEGKTAIMCILDAATRCPDLMKQAGGPGAQLGGMGLNATAITEMGGFDMYCAMMTGQGGECAKIQQCVTMQPQPDQGGMADMERLGRYMTQNLTNFKEAKPYLFFQQQSKMVCGSMKPMLSCIMDALEKCPQMKAQMEESMKGMSEALKGSVFQDLHIMNFDEQMSLIKNECPKIPQSFASDQCVQKQLMSADFTKCHSEFSEKYPTDEAKKDCSAYDDLHMCMKEALEPCELDSLNIYERNLPNIVGGIQQSCVKETSGSGNLRVSLITAIMAGVVMLVL